MNTPTSTSFVAREQIKSYIQRQRRLIDRHYRRHEIVRSECTVLPVQNDALNTNGVTPHVHDWLTVTGLLSLEPHFGELGVHDSLNLGFLATATLLGPDVAALVPIAFGASPTLAASLLDALAFMLE